MSPNDTAPQDDDEDDGEVMEFEPAFAPAFLVAADLVDDSAATATDAAEGDDARASCAVMVEAEEEGDVVERECVLLEGDRGSEGDCAPKAILATAEVVGEKARCDRR